MYQNFDLDEIRNLTIGTVDSVSPIEIKVQLETNAPQNVAINTGVPTPFPKINGYVLIPNEQGAIVGVIHWLGVEHSSYPKRKGFRDFDLIDLPFPLRRMSLTPLGVLHKKDEDSFEVERGVYSYPSVGDNVILPTDRQLRAIVNNPDGRVEIGTAPIAGNSPIQVCPNKLFGRHLAVLGNTGSGKSCSVAGLIRWSLEAAGDNPNARFIILDPNGEYSKTFDDLGISKVRKFSVKLNDNEKTFKRLQIPAWMWNSHEWISFSRAAPGAQRPMLLKTLADLKQGKAIGDSISVRLSSFLHSRKNLLQSYLANCPHSESNYPRFMGFIDTLKLIITDIDYYISSIKDENLRKGIVDIKTKIDRVLQKKRRESREGNEYYTNFCNADLESINETFNAPLRILDKISPQISTINFDTPQEFNIDELVPYLEQLAETEGGNFVQFVQMLSLRMRFLLSDERLNSVVQPEKEITLIDWLESYIGSNNSENGAISIIDLSLIPSEIIHIIVAVLSRLTFEAIQRYRKINHSELPTTLVLEEAHTFLRQTDENICLETFQRIAREGRKFGLSMVLSSQRPSELSPTVLSQCNTFLLHRIVNDRDQDLVNRLVPDSLSGLLKELPVLPSRKAILVGWAYPLPVLVEMKYLEKHHRPHSNDPEFWEVWTGKEERSINWKIIANDWQGIKQTPTNDDEPDDDSSISDIFFENDIPF